MAPESFIICTVFSALSCVGSNPVKDSPCLELEFETFPSHDVLYPSMEDFKEYARFAEGLSVKPDPSKKGKNVSNYNVLFVPPQKDISNDEMAMLEDVAKRDPLAEISEQEKVSLWRLRRHCRDKLPDILPRFLDAVKWNSRDDVTQLYLLLETWPKVSQRVALELLDCKYADPEVRRLAVAWLDGDAQTSA